MCCEEIPSFIKYTFAERSPTENFLINFRRGELLGHWSGLHKQLWYLRNVDLQIAGGNHPASITIVSYDRPKSRTVVWGWLRPVSLCWWIVLVSWTLQFGRSWSMQPPLHAANAPTLKDLWPEETVS